MAFLPPSVVLSTSTTTSAPVSASSSPSPVATSTPSERASGTTSCPRRRASSTTYAPTTPVAPATAIRTPLPPDRSTTAILSLAVRGGFDRLNQRWLGLCASYAVGPLQLHAG